MSIDKSLARKGTTSSNRSVMTRAERITHMQSIDKWPEAGRSPYGLPKTRIIKLVLKKAKKEKAVEEKPAKGKKK